MRGSTYADLSPLFAFLFVIGMVFLLDRERASHPQAELAAAETAAERRAGALADVLGNELSARLASFAAAKVTLAQVSDPASETAFMASLDSVIVRMDGVIGAAIVYPETERIIASHATGLGRAVTLQDSAVRLAYLRALGTHRVAATAVVEYGSNRRVFVFDPIVRDDTSRIVAMLAAELDPHTIYRVVTASGVLDTISGGPLTHTLYGPGGVRLSGFQVVPEGWGAVVRDVRVADSAWRIEVSYPVPDLRAYRAERLATWVAGLALALTVAVILHFLRRTIRMQKEEIARRQAAEEAARAAAEESRQRALHARELAAQLEAAQRQSQRLSTSLDPDDVVEQFLGGVAEILDADVASLYTFEEEGEVLVGRRRMVFRDIEGITDRLRREDIEQVRAPVALLPLLGEAVSTGEPYVVGSADEDGQLVASRTGPDTGVASITVPLLIAGHTVGVASWEVYSRPHRFPPALVAFAQALGAPAAAALRTAELFASLEAERRRAAREALRFGAVLDQMADGVIVVDAQGRVERSNAAAAELLGHDLSRTPVAEWPARFDLVSAEGRPLSPAEFPLTRSMRGETVRRATFIVRCDWGSERHLSCSAGPILDRHGAPAGAAMVLHDVTDEHQYAEMLRHTNRELRRQADVLEQVNHQLREATKAKDQFMAVMSHELRTPINAIMGYSDLLDLGVKGPLNNEQRSMLTRVRETSRHLLGLINEVLDLAKIGAGRMDLVMVELDAAAIVDRAAQQILPLAAAKGLRLEVEEPAARPAPVFGDETRLTQIIVNLLSNAVKFTNAGAVIATCEEVDGEVLIQVGDTGPGIPPDQAERIFEEFYQVEGGLSRASGGTGLGLAIARRFARLMDGDITVDSEVGRGSVFTLRLPSANAGARRTTATSGTTVLLLDGEDEVERVQDSLEGAVRVLGATEPARLAALARTEQPRLVAISMDAPDHAAWRTLSALQLEAATSSIPALLFTHGGAAADGVLDLGLVSVLSKPIAVEHAAAMVLHQLNGRPSPTVLVADYDPHGRRILGEALTAAGCNVETASSGAEALDKARRLTPHAVVIDLLMPGMNGVETLALLRQEPRLQSTAVVVLISREPSTAEMEQLTAAVAGLATERIRLRRTPEILLNALEQTNGSRYGAHT
jgi:PAS domain S-box-containing protein